MTTAKPLVRILGALLVAAAILPNGASAQRSKPIDVDKARVVEYWTPERRAAAIPRDLVIDPRGLGYLRLPGGALHPYGHDVAAHEAQLGQTPTPFAKPGGGSGDTTPPAIPSMDPVAGQTISASYTFKATVTDAGGIRSVRFKVQKTGSTFVNSFSPSSAGNNVWSVTIQGFSDGDWTWWVEAKDNAGNLAKSPTVAFKVGTSTGGGGSGSDIVTNAVWTIGAVKTAAGRIYFEMPSNAKRTRWTGYVCSGTVANDSGTTGRSIIITAAHCVYDDANKAFARNVMFIPNQAATTGTGTDLNCGNDPLGCWVPSFGVVDVNWTTKTFPDNVAWDYAFYVVSDSGAHSTSTRDQLLDGALDGAVTAPFTIKFDDPSHDHDTSADYTYALGYSYSDDPKFMYCAQNLTTLDAANWWLGSCGLSGGSSGGLWVQNGTTTWSGMTDASIISVNSWGYTNSPGMAGPKLFGTSASNIFAKAKCLAFSNGSKPAGDAGVAVTTSTTCP